ncbi:MAG: Rne/Rng family ribonuclease [Paraclostridium sp.]
MKSVVIESLVASQKTAVLEDGKLVELLVEDNCSAKSVSNVYRGVVKKALKGMEAFFVDVGSEKLGYLPMKNNEVVKCGNDVLVQINKEAVGTKGAKLTTEVSFAGRYLVYIPSNDRLTISNKIGSEKERFRLKKIVQRVDNDFTGIIRTEAVGCDEEDLDKDVKELKAKFEEVEKEFKLGMGPKLLYKDLDFASKYVKDNVNDDLDKIIVNNKDKYDELKEILKNIDKTYTDKLILEENKDIFDLYRVQSQVEKCLNKKVWLKSGGYLIIEKTEALTVIDVNTGKFVGNSKLEETVYKTNLEAAIEIARQLRIRDIGGIIIIDFIDMNKSEYKKRVMSVLESELKKDKRKSEVLGMTRLGLVEVARRREKDSIEKYYIDDCQVCNGNTGTKSISYMIDEIEKEIMRISEHTSYSSVIVELNPNMLRCFDENYINIIKLIGEKYRVEIYLKENPKIVLEKMNIIFNS